MKALETRIENLKDKIEPRRREERGVKKEGYGKSRTLIAKLFSSIGGFQQGFK
jgi:hypothetical protein